MFVLYLETYEKTKKVIVLMKDGQGASVRVGANAMILNYTPQVKFLCLCFLLGESITKF